MSQEIKEPETLGELADQNVILLGEEFISKQVEIKKKARRLDMEELIQNRIVKNSSGQHVPHPKLLKKKGFRPLYRKDIDNIAPIKPAKHIVERVPNECKASLKNIDDYFSEAKPCNTK